MKVEIIEMPELRVAFVTHIGPYFEVSEAFARLGQIAGAAGLFGPSHARLGIYHDDPRTTPAAELRSEAALVIGPHVAVPHGLSERKIPAGRYAQTVHVGPYEKLPEIWPRLMGEWLPQSGHRMRNGLSFEIYRNTPGDVPEERLITELYIAIA